MLGSSDHALGSVEKIDWIFTIRNNESFKSKSFQQLCLHFRATSSDRFNGVRSNCSHNVLEFISFNLSKFLSRFNLKLVLLFDMADFRLKL